MVRRLGTSSVGLLALAAAMAAVVLLAVLGMALPIVAALVALLAVAVVVSLAGAGAGHLVVLAGASTALSVGLVHGDRLGLGFGIAIALALAAAAADEPLSRRLAPTVRAAQLPGVRSDRRTGAERPFLGAVAVAVAVLGVAGALVALPAHGSILAEVIGGLAGAGVLAVLVLAVIRLRTMVLGIRDASADRAVTVALEAYAPEFVLHFSGPPEGDYQVRMWVPYLSQLGRRFVILTRDHQMVARAASLGDVPLISSPRLAGLEACLVDSIRAVFHVNTDSLCVDLVRFHDRTQVQLNHGDSDKPSSFHPMNAMFDQIFVAGQAAIDRFVDHGIDIPAEKFVIVGRPQVADIVTTNLDPIAVPTVLYAPTWRGGTSDMSLTSLWSGLEVVETLVELGARVAFRPHPYSLRDKESAAAVARIDARLAAASTAERPHLTSAQTRTGTIAHWFNRSDALVSDVSSVAVDHLQSGKPLAITQVQHATSSANLPAAYLLPLGGDLRTPLATMLGDDPLADRRADARTHYLGDIPDDERMAHFLRAAAAAVAD